MFKTTSFLFSLVLIACLAGCSDAPKCTDSDVNIAVLEKIRNAVKNQALFQEIMLDSYIVKPSPTGAVQAVGGGKLSCIDNDVISDNSEKKDPVEDKFILSYAAHPKYYFWKAKNDPGMNLILAKADKFVDELNVRLSDIKEDESGNDKTECACSAKASIGQEKLVVKYTAKYSKNGKIDIEVKDNNDTRQSGSQPIHGSISALCNAWENAKASTFPPTKPQVIAACKDYDDQKDNKLNIRFGTLIPDDLTANGKVLNKGLRSYKILQK